MPLTNRLSPLDAAFLYFERPHQRLHVGCVAVLDGRVPFEAFSLALTERLTTMERYRQRPVRPLLDLGLPRWEHDPTFEPRRHLRHVAVPEPGDEAAFTALASELFATRMDPRHPLWEAYLIDGLVGGASALLFKVHHSMIDGVSGAQVLEAITDRLDETPPIPVAPPTVGRDVGETLRRATHPEAWWERARDAAEFLRVAGDLLFGTVGTAPPFNGPLTDARRLIWTSFEMDQFLAIRGAAGAKVNDVVLAVIAGALRRYLLARDDRQEPASIRALVPVSVRRPDQHLNLGNFVTALFPTLPLDEPDPWARLLRIAAETRTLKARGQDRASSLFLSLAGALPAPLSALAARLLPDTSLVHTVVTNVPGPRQPRTFLGHPIREVHPIVPLFWGMGLEFAVLSYGDRLSICAAVDPHLVPDAENLRHELRREAAALAAALSAREPAVANGPAAVRVADLMTTRIVTVVAEHSLAQAWDLMALHRIRHLPVVDSHGRLLGLITHRDLLAATSSSLAPPRRDRPMVLAGHCIGDIMETHVRTTSPDDPAALAGEYLVRHRIGCLPVVAPGGQLVGIVTESDYLRWATARMASTQESPRREAVG